MHFYVCKQCIYILNKTKWNCLLKQIIANNVLVIYYYLCFCKLVTIAVCKLNIYQVQLVL